MKIILHMTLAADAKAPEADMELREEQQIKDLLEQMEVSLSDVGIILKNGTWVKPDAYAGNNDKIEVFPVLAGG